MKASNDMFDPRNTQVKVSALEENSLNERMKERPMSKHPSRRNFLGMSSVALASAALVGMTANAQEAANTRKAEYDHSSSDPGQENKPLLAENPDSNNSPPTDHGDMVPIWYSFDLVKKRIEEGGWTHEVTQSVLPPSRDTAGVNMRLAAGSYRELYWHTADEWAYVLYGNARVTVMNPDGTMFIADVSEGDLWVFPAGFPHSIQGLEPDGTQFLLVFPQGNFSEDGTMLISEWLAHTPPEVLAKNTGSFVITHNLYWEHPLFVLICQFVPRRHHSRRSWQSSSRSGLRFSFSAVSLSRTVQAKIKMNFSSVSCD
jgi:oxalate decarboxylase